MIKRSETIAGKLCDEILAGIYKPGERLPAERDLAHQLGANRGSVREALLALERMGLVTTRRGDGHTVRPLREAHPGDAAGEAQVVADHRAGAGLTADCLRLEHDGGEPLGRAVHRGRETRGPGADHRQVGDEVGGQLRGRAVHRRGEVGQRRPDHDVALRCADDRE